MSTREPVRIGNIAGFYGDRLSAATDMIMQGQVDVLTGDYLAELTMFILWKAKQKDPGTGYAVTFLAQMEGILGECLDRGIKVVVNAGGLNPLGLRERLAHLADDLGLSPKLAAVSGDDILRKIPELQAQGIDLAHLDTGVSLAAGDGEVVTANAYLGGWGIAEALAADADIVICPRVTDASLAVGSAAWWHGWAGSDFDALAGAVAAGHVIECGPQACGGNYPWLDEVVDRRYPGYPIAEIAADGTSVITKHEGTGGMVTVGTVTAQLLYEIGPPGYLNPDVIARFDTATLTQEGPDRVRIDGVRGKPPTGTLKVVVNRLGGYRNSVTMVITGEAIEEKAAWAQDLLFADLGGRDQFAEVDVHLSRFDREDARTEELAGAHLTITVKDPDKDRVGRRFTNAATGLYLGGYAGFHTLTPPRNASAFARYWPTLVPADTVAHSVTLPDGELRSIPASPSSAVATPFPAVATAREVAASAREAAATAREVAAPETEWPAVPEGRTKRLPLGSVCGARSGDKGGNVNVGLWTREATAFSWLRSWLTVERFRELVPEVKERPVTIHELPNLLALNIVVTGLLGEGVASSTRPDPQAKALGEYVRSRHVDIPAVLLGGRG